MEITHIVHSVAFHRSGECNRCGACNCEKLNCRHFSWDEKGLVTCDIHDKKTEVCKECTNDKDAFCYMNGALVTHQMCEDYPDHPWLTVIREGKCEFRFEKID